MTFIGCGQRAVFLALTFADAGFKVTCTDSDQSVIKRLSKANLPLGNREAETKLKTQLKTEQIAATADMNAASKNDIIIVAVDAKLDSKKTSDDAEVKSVCKTVGAALQKGGLVVYVGVGGFEFTENVVKETLENTSGLVAGEDFGLAYIPILNVEWTQTVDDWIVAGNDKFSLNAAAQIFEAATQKPVKRVPSTKTAELALLFAAAKNDAEKALANDLAAFCENAQIDYTQTVKILSAKWACPEPSISEEEHRNEAYLLLESAENLGTKLRLPAVARHVNEDMVRHALNLTQDALRSLGKTVRRARVAVLGFAESGTAAGLFVELLTAKGAKVNRYDPNAAPENGKGSLVKKTLNETVEATDCVVIVSGQESFKRLNLKKLRALMKSPVAFIDLTGGFEPSKVEEVGFTYRGLGRGVYRK